MWGRAAEKDVGEVILQADTSGELPPFRPPVRDHPLTGEQRRLRQKEPRPTYMWAAPLCVMGKPLGFSGPFLKVP